MSTETLKRKQAIQPIPSNNQMAYQGLQWFHDTPKTESAMYLRFQTLPKPLYEALMKFYSLKTDMQLFSYICKWWAVKCA